MKRLNDEQIQSLLENGLNATDESLSESEREQLDGYSFLFQKLKSEPTYTLPFNFASAVTQKVRFRLKSRSDLKYNLFAALGIITCFFAVCGLLYMVNADAGNQFFMAMLKLKWGLLTGMIILLGTLVFDQKVKTI